jgi:hypothetical protein
MSKINNLTPNVQIHQQQATKMRTTVDSSFGAKLRDGLNATAKTVGSLAGSAVAAVPGGTVLSAALSGASQVGTSAAALTANAGQSPVAAAGGGGLNVGGLTSGAPTIPGNSKSQVSSQFGQAKELFEMQSAFNLQFLQLQANMQHESRQFQTMSNVLKNRHQTASNSIRNVN